MADNLAVKDGNGALQTLAFADISNVLYPKHNLVGSAGAALLPNAAALADALANPTATVLGALQIFFNGTTWDRLRLPNVFKDVSTVAIGSIVTVWTPASGKKFRLMGGMISASAAVNVLFEDNAAGAGNFLYRTPTLVAATPFVFTVPGNGRLSAAADQVLKATGSGAANLVGTLWGTEES